MRSDDDSAEGTPGPESPSGLRFGHIEEVPALELPRGRMPRIERLRWWHRLFGIRNMDD